MGYNRPRMNALQISGLAVTAGGIVDSARERPAWGIWGIVVGLGLFVTGSYSRKRTPTAEDLAGPPVEHPSYCTEINGHQVCMYQASVDHARYYYQIEERTPVLSSGGINEAEAEAIDVLRSWPDWT